MPAAAFIVASLAALEPPRVPVERPIAILQISWSLTAAPRALAAAEQRPPAVGPAQVVLPEPVPPEADKPKPQGEVEVLPAPDSQADQLDDLKDPAATASTGPASTGPASTDAAAADPLADPAAATAAGAPDPLEDELATSIKRDNDPLEFFNRFSFSLSMKIDKILLRPLSLGYRKYTPKPARDGLRNVLTNFSEPMVIVNDLLQLKPKRALHSLARFLLNTTLGLAGLFDVAKEKKFNIPYHGNRFSNTLGFYGMKAGPYLYLPVLGPTSLREQGDRVQGFIPFFDNPIFRNGRGEAFGYLSGLDLRAENDDALQALLDDSVDPYASFRTTWLQDRQGEIDRLKAEGKKHGASVASPLDDPLIDPAPASAAPAAPATAPAAPPTESATPAP